MEEVLSREHAVNYTRGQLTITGVKEVRSFEDKEVNLNLEGNGMTIKGSNLTVAELNLKSGFLKIDGVVDSIIYTHSYEKLGIVKRLFK
jgi:sporulation protein YabP